MGIFGKSGDYLDIPALQKKGLVKLPEPKVDKGIKVTKEGYVELTNEYSPEGESVTAPVNPVSSGSTGGFGSFFDAPAPSASTSSNSGGSIFDSLDNSSNNNSSSYFGNSGSNNSDSLNIQHLKAKFEDIEFKIDRLIEKIDKMEDRLR